MKKARIVLMFVLIFVIVSLATGCTLAIEEPEAVANQTTLEGFLGEDFINGVIEEDKMVGLMLWFTDDNYNLLTPLDFNDANKIMAYINIDKNKNSPTYGMSYITSGAEYFELSAYYKENSFMGSWDYPLAEPCVVPEANYLADKNAKIQNNIATGVYLTVYVTPDFSGIVNAESVYKNSTGDLYSKSNEYGIHINGIGGTSFGYYHETINDNKTYDNTIYKNLYFAEYKYFIKVIEVYSNLRFLEYDSNDTLLSTVDYPNAESLLAVITDNKYSVNEDCEYVIIEETLTDAQTKQPYINRTIISRTDKDKYFTTKTEINNTKIVNLSQITIFFS